MALLSAAVPRRPEAQRETAAGLEATLGGWAQVPWASRSQMEWQVLEEGPWMGRGCRPGSKGTDLVAPEGPSDSSGPCP